MQLDSTCAELLQHRLDAPLDRRMVRAIASDKLFNYGSQSCGRQLRVGDAHRIMILGKAKSTIGSLCSLLISMD